MAESEGAPFSMACSTALMKPEWNHYINRHERTTLHKKKIPYSCMVLSSDGMLESKAVF